MCKANATGALAEAFLQSSQSTAGLQCKWKWQAALGLWQAATCFRLPGLQPLLPSGILLAHCPAFPSQGLPAEQAKLGCNAGRPRLRKSGQSAKRKPLVPWLRPSCRAAKALLGCRPLWSSLQSPQQCFQVWQCVQPGAKQWMLLWPEQGCQS